MSDRVSVPDVIQRAAWECAFMLSTEFADRLSPDQTAFVGAIDLAGPDIVTWATAGRLFRLWSRFVQTRV